LTASVCCVRWRSILPSSRRLSAKNSEVSAPEAMRSAKVVACHKDCQSRTTNTAQLQALVTHTYFSCCATDAATPFAAAAEVISPPVQNLDHGSSEAPTSPFVPVAAAIGPADTTTGTKASCPDSAPTPYSSQKHRIRQKKNSPTGARPVWASNMATPHQVVVHGKLHGDSFSPRHRRLSSARWRGGPPLSGRRGRRRHTDVGGGGLYAWPRHLHLTPWDRQPNVSPTLLPLRILAILLHHCRYNSTNIPSIRENLHVTS
jgi:hypothetical protein